MYNSFYRLISCTTCLHSNSETWGGFYCEGDRKWKNKSHHVCVFSDKSSALLDLCAKHLES